MEKVELRILVVDDERLSRQTSIRMLRQAGFTAQAVENAYRALEVLDEVGCDVLLCDLRMPGMDGLELLRKVRKSHPDVDVILMTAYATVETAVAAMQAGAVDYVTKPFRFTELEHRLRRLGELRLYRDEVRSLRRLLDDSAERCGILGESRATRQVLELVGTYADQMAPVLITGETGTGKELVSRALHRRGPRARRPFVPVACGAIPRELADSELFGHEKGSFTGASAQRSGAFERAHGGTLLLDDIDDLSLNIQAKLLRALQEGEIHRVGGERQILVDVRVVATTKVDLAEAAAEGRFRDDLLYRLRGLEIHLAPLRERPEDLLPLSTHFLAMFARGQGRDAQTISPEALDALHSYQWPGNVRELRNAIESAAVACRGQVIGVEHLPPFVQGAQAEGGGRLFSLRLEGRRTIPFGECVREFEDALVSWALHQSGGQQSKAAELLELPRTTFQSKMKRRTD